MSISTVKTVATRFLTNDRPEVMALKGTWGVGKTHAWNSLVLDCKADIKFPNYCYVSLFGVSSIGELRTAIFTKTRSVSRLKRELDAETINAEWLGIVGDGAKELLRFGTKFIKELPYGKNVTVGLETLAPYLVRNTIVCLDDFERLAAESGAISAEEVLGLISELKEERNCKVALIFNEEKLPSKDTYSKYREKVIDLELLYDPTPDEATEIAFPHTLPFRALAKKHCIALGVRNIRVLRKIVGLVELINGITAPLHPRVMEQAVHTIVLAAWCYFDSDDHKPSYGFLRNWNQFLWSFKLENDKPQDAKEVAWSGLLQSYGITHIDEFDLTLFKVIERGYAEETGCEAAAKDIDAQLRAHELEQSFHAAWELFHNTFANNEKDLVASLCESFKRSVAHINPINLNGTTILLRDLGHNQIADELIDFYLDARGNEESILELKDYPFSGDVRDPAIWKKFGERKAMLHRIVPLVEAAQYVVENDSNSDIHLDALRRATEDEYYDLFKRYSGDGLSKLVGTCLRFESWPNEQKVIGERARAALVRIGNESQLNAIRIRRFGITVAKPNTPTDMVAAAAQTVDRQ